MVNQEPQKKKQKLQKGKSSLQLIYMLAEKSFVGQPFSTEGTGSPSSSAFALPSNSFAPHINIIIKGDLHLPWSTQNACGLRQQGTGGRGRMDQQGITGSIQKVISNKSACVTLSLKGAGHLASSSSLCSCLHPRGSPKWQRGLTGKVEEGKFIIGHYGHWARAIAEVARRENAARMMAEKSS